MKGGVLLQAEDEGGEQPLDKEAEVVLIAAKPEQRRGSVGARRGARRLEAAGEGLCLEGDGRKEGRRGVQMGERKRRSCGEKVQEFREGKWWKKG